MVGTASRINRPFLSLIHEVPYETALILRILAYKVPILLETAHRVTHCMCIFTLDERFCRIALQIFLTMAVPIIHRTCDIGIRSVPSIPIIKRTLIMNRP